MTYYDDVLRVLSNNPVDFNTLLDLLQVPKTKTTYVIAALKKGLVLGTIIKHKNLSEKRLYIGHKYSLYSDFYRELKKD